MTDTARDRLSELPSELLIQVFQQCCDFSSLWSLRHTSSRLRGIFDSNGPEIVQVVLNSTVPIQSRILMWHILGLQTGSFTCARYAEARRDSLGYTALLGKLVATAEQLRSFVRLAHRVHVAAHLCLSKCIQNCLATPLGERGYHEGFEHPTWIEEQRTILGLWRVLYRRELRAAGKHGRLAWSSSDLDRLKFRHPDEDMEHETARYQAMTTEWFLWKLGNPQKADEWHARELSHKQRPFSLLLFPEGTEFGWSCQPQPSPAALDQGKDLTQEPLPRPPSPTPVVSDDSESESSDSQLDDGDDVPESRLSLNRVVRSSMVRNFSTRSLRWYGLPNRVQHFGQTPPRGESLNLDAETLGLEFWRNMRDDENSGDGQYMFFTGYLKYGLALWDEQRMVALGLWSSDAIHNPSEYFRRWYDFLDDADILNHSAKYEEAVYFGRA